MHLLLPRIFSLLHVCVQARVVWGRVGTRPKALAFESLEAKQTKKWIPKKLK
jgi:glutaminase